MENDRKDLEFYRMDNQNMNDAVERIVVKIHTMKKKFDKKITLLTGCGPATGVTSLSIDLAMELSMARWKTLLIDCDLRKSVRYRRIATKVSVGLSEYLSKEAEKEDIIMKTNREFLDYISCGNVDGSVVSLLCSPEMSSLMESVSKEYDYIIIDSPSINIVSDSDILFQYVDGIALVAAIDKTTKKQLEDAKRKVSHYSDKYYGLIINQVDMKQYKDYVKDYDYFEKNNMAKKYLDDMKKVSKKRGTKQREKEAKK